ncbi:hypothetical protein MTR67_027260 [Solanum verrucosum]|uniref:Uncharacterized protein n=1 Tax=Solanum verrucosum TaxID=315347 RepID=A0AAF0R3U1_SOLVR|nr:hypothetical protein MTR67_027260 [Solanum verrucosum]
MFVEIPNKKIDMKVKLPVINDLENPASHMFDEMFQTFFVVKGEYNDLLMFNMQLGTWDSPILGGDVWNVVNLHICPTYKQRVTRNSVFCVSSDDLDHDKLIMSTLWNSCIWVDNILEQNLPGFLSYKSRVFGREEKLQGLLEALAARYSEQFPNILVNKDDVLLFAKLV